MSPIYSASKLASYIHQEHPSDMALTMNLSVVVVFAQSVRIKLGLPRSAQLSICFEAKSFLLHLCEGPD